MPPNLGEIPNSDLRDAVHIPVVAAMSYGVLQPGQSVKIGLFGQVLSVDGPGDGIVDPFLKAPVPAGTKFWLFMRKIDGQPRHTWTAPGFQDEIEAAREAGEEATACCYGG